MYSVTLLVLLALISIGAVTGDLASQFDDDQVCGPHPLKKIVLKVEAAKPGIDQAGLIDFLAKIKVSMPNVWEAYESNLAAYQNCKIMSAGGSLGRRRK
uniref:Uncharacterized protein n=1 Tax=Plectus sambesii TaxID=2011161 RepID=A0A914WGH4_9BILA